MYLHRRVQKDALREIVLLSSPVLDDGFSSKGNLEEPSGAKGSGRHGRHYGRCLICRLALQAQRLIGTHRLSFPQAFCGLGRSWRIIQEVPNLSLSIAKRKAKKVSSIGMKI
jgi:hypothetical protein